MRIIAGEHRGRRIVAPEGLTTRPMTDRVRENLFNLLGSLVDGARVLDLFCGSGALGLESLSRGAAHAMFIDTDKDAIAAAEANGRTLGLQERMRVLRRDVFRPGPWIAPPGGGAYTIVFVDPPYRMTDAEREREDLASMIRSLADLGCIAPGTVAMLRAKRGVETGTPWPGFDLHDERTYGTTTLYLMIRRGEKTE